MSGERIELLPAPLASTDWRVMLRVAAGIIIFTFVVLGGWSAVARIDSGVVADGVIAVESNRKTIQHLEGGIVREILVRDGDTVQQGDTLIRLDPTRNEATDRGFRQQLAIASAALARMTAQRDMLDVIDFPREVTAFKDDPVIANAIRDNQGQFDNRRQSLLRGIEVLEKQIAQARDEIRQATVDQKTAQDQVDSIDVELPNLRGLLEKGLVALPRVTTLERQQIQVRGQLESAKINGTKAKEKVGELQARIDQLKQDYRQEGGNTLPDVRKLISDAGQQLIIAKDALRRIDIQAPVAGTVQQLKIFTIGGVVKPGDPILDIVPLSDTLVVRAKVQPIDVDRILTGEKAEIRVPQFMKFELKPLEGVIRSISRDSIIDTSTNPPLSYFAVEVAVDRNSIPEDIRDRMIAGMTVDTIIRTQERTVLSYLAAPLRNRLAKSMRER
ncbi:HlyD family type I secretion periplasmic adaptor subunit [Bradyrhizobium prioriisuperbiae]|uniref:HlyD family type I secretion periplasmic adaptor subunit n=1 Tax=Bradyrhizobium prioriisuperbiae TaxID=2854389 RepID=UPI0028EBF7AE|nr:HlyD family type I secretion periplasmic adaptor subunit [Bradyrhizobium prioritasuperba]